jgi:hypothetical protein
MTHQYIIWNWSLWSINRMRLQSFCKIKVGGGIYTGE